LGPVFFHLWVALFAGGEQSVSRPDGAKPAAAKTNPAPAPRARIGVAAQRNENVAVYLIDTNAIKEANIRLGTTVQAVPEFAPETFHFATEHGRPAAETLLLRTAAPASDWHGEMFAWHQNSVFNARTFFQVGGVKPSRRNVHGFRSGGEVGNLGWLSLNGTQRKIRGMVNGNVLVPLAGERTPLATDPARRVMIQRFLNAYPAELPNRPDFDPRALNTNSPQSIDEVSGSARLDRTTPGQGRLSALYSNDRQRIDAFQLVAGQNPDTEIHSQKARLNWRRPRGARTEIAFGFTYSRNRSVLVSEPNAVGPRVRLGFQIEELGPDSHFPINRATNSFRWGGAWQHTRGAHTVTAGADWTRFQLNGVESGNQRGYYQFTSNFGRPSIENLRLGDASSYEIALGELSRGYRNNTLNAYFGDRWKVNAKLTVAYGVRFNAETRPFEVQRRETIPYSGDWNNWSPRFGFAWQMGRGWVLRSAYTTTFAQILPVTWQQIRNNPPGVFYLQVQSPDLVNPLRGLDLTGGNVRYTPTWLSPDLATPYAHQYNASFERRLAAGSTLRLAYVGSRTIKLVNSFILNRAEVVPGVPLTTATVDQRRRDPRYYDTRTVVNGGVAWFDAALAAWDLPLRRGLTLQTAYTFSKALDQGPDFSATAANRDILSQRSQSQYDSFKDRKGRSNFDSPHSWFLNYTWDLPVPAGGNGWTRKLLGGWQATGANLWKKGTPLTLYIGSDGPGYGNVDGGTSDRPHILDPSILGATIANPESAVRLLQRERFAFIRPGETAGNLGRNNFRKARIWNWNAALQKQWRLHHNEWTAQLRGEAYNLSNTPQFDEPQRNLSAPPFGKITNTLNDGRVFQFVLRFLF
jgi:hypothetical protein